MQYCQKWPQVILVIGIKRIRLLILLRDEVEPERANRERGDTLSLG
jgi:hypothetical protein